MDEEMKKLQKAHEEAMAGIEAFNKSMHEGINSIKDYIGMAK